MMTFSEEVRSITQPKALRQFMDNLAPDIFRQRLLIEGFYTIDVNETVIKNYFESVTKSLDLRMYGEPIIFSPASLGKEDNQGYDAFAPLIDSGICIYIWSRQKFLSAVIYTCNDFNETLAVDATTNFFKTTQITFQSF